MSRRFRYEGGKVIEVGKQENADLNKPIVSDALGFIESQFDEMEADRVKNGHVGVEFVRDKDVPQFYQVKCSSQDAWSRYVKHRGMFDRNSRNGGSASIGKAELEQAERLAREQYSPQKEEEFLRSVLKCQK